MADPKVKVDAIVDDTQAVQQLGKTLRNLQQAADALSKSMTTATTAGAKYDATMAKAALANEKLAQASARTALAQQKLATEAERTAAAHSRTEAATARAAATTLRAETAQLRAATAHQKAETAAQRQADAQRKLEQDTSAVKQGVDALANTLRNITLVAGVLGTTFKQAFDWAKQGAQITQTTASFQNFAENIAEMPDLLDQMKDASNGTISEMELMRHTLTLVTGTSQEAGAALARQAPHLLEIARAAQILNPALGDVDYFFQSLATGIKRLEPRWIDNLGLIVKARDAYAAHARMLGISTQALTAEQKSQAFLNEVLRVGNLLIEQNAGATESAVDPWSRFEVQIQEATNSLKQFLAQGLLPYIQLMNGEFQASNAGVEQINQGVVLSLEELAEAYGKARDQQALFVALAPYGLGKAFVDIDQTTADVVLLEREMAKAAGSYEEFARIMGQSTTMTDVSGQTYVNEELLATYEAATKGIGAIATEADRTKPAITGLTGSMLALQYAMIPTVELTEEQVEALAKLREAQSDAAIGTVEGAASLTEFQKQLLTTADNANLSVGEVYRFAEAMGILTEEEAQAAQNAYVFQQTNQKMLNGVANGTLEFDVYQRTILALARRLGIDYQTAAQKAAQSTQLLTTAANFGLGSIVRFGQGLGNAAIQAQRLKKSNDAAGQSVQRLAAVSGGAASAFINALEGGATGGGGGGVSAIDAAVQAQQEWNAAFAQSFIQLLDAEEPIENWNTELLKSAAAAGASAETLALLAAATGEYSEEQIRTALHGAAMRQAIEEIAAALADGRATTDEALAAVVGFQEQLAQGGDFQFNIEDFGIEPLQEAIAGAGGGAGGAAEQTGNWTSELLKLASQGRLTADELVILASATGDYTDAEIQAAVKALLMTQKLEELARQIDQGTKKSITELITELQEFENDLDKELELQFSTGDAEESIRRVRGGLDEIPRDITVEIHVKADPIPDFSNIPGSQNPQSGSQIADQHGGPLAQAQHGLGLPGTTLVGEVRPEIVVGGQVIPRIPPGFFMDQGGFAESVAAALAGSMVAPPSYNNTTNINRTTTTNNNQRSVVINNPTSNAAATNRLELGAF